MIGRRGSAFVHGIGAVLVAACGLDVVGRAVVGEVEGEGDGGAEEGGPEPDAAAADAGSDVGRDDADAGDATVLADSGDPDALARCTTSTCASMGGVCDLNGTCVRICAVQGACQGSACPPGIPCRVDCSAKQSCLSVSCNGAQHCVVDCRVGNACENDLFCGDASTCAINCHPDDAGGPSCNGNVDCQQTGPATCTVACDGGCNGSVRCCESNACTVIGGPASTPEGFCPAND